MRAAPNAVLAERPWRSSGRSVPSEAKFNNTRWLLQLTRKTNNLTQDPAGIARAPSGNPSLESLVACSPEELNRYDIAAVNLACADGLPGSESLNIAACLATLDQWASRVRRYTRDAWNDYQRDPEQYNRQRGFFRFLCLVTVLKHPNGLGVGYAEDAIGKFTFTDSRDDLLHGVLTHRRGTCASLPVLYVSIGRRLGYPMYLATAKNHVLCQWVNEDGSRLNLEGSCPGGGQIVEDGYYHTWPQRMSATERASGHYLRGLTPAQELALFLETRGHCLADNRRFDEARKTYQDAYRVSSGWSQMHGHLWSLEMIQRRFIEEQRGQGCSQNGAQKGTANDVFTSNRKMADTRSRRIHGWFESLPD